MIAVAMTLIVTIVRIILTPQMQDVRTGEFQLSFVVIGLMVVAAGVVIALSYLAKVPALPAIEGKPMQAAAWMLLSLGVVMTVTALYDAFVWMRTGIAPPPTQTVVGTADRLSLLGSLLFGLLGGVYGIRQGWSWIAGGRFVPGQYRFFPLALPLWLWMRLAWYVVSYASAVSVTETFYDYTMLIVSLLFAMSLSRYLSGQSTYRSPGLLWQALVTLLCGVSSTVTRFVMYIIGETEAYQASELASFPDLILALFAGCFGLALVLGKRPVDPSKAEEEEPEMRSEAQSVLEELVPEKTVSQPEIEQ